jgi:hypothetical protein
MSNSVKKGIIWIRLSVSKVSKERGINIYGEAKLLLDSPWGVGRCYLRIRQGCYEGGRWEKVSNEVG